MLIQTFLQGDAADQNAFQSKGANATLKSCEKEVWLTSPQMNVLENFNDPEAQQQEMNKKIQGIRYFITYSNTYDLSSQTSLIVSFILGYNSSICTEIIETQEVSAHSFSSRKESEETPHIRDSQASTSSSNSCDNTSIKSQASFDGGKF